MPINERWQTFCHSLQKWTRPHARQPALEKKSRQAIETLRCLDEGVLRTEVEANLGGIFAIGFPAHTGGAIQFIRGIGIDAFAARAKELADAYGERFTVSAAALDKLRNEKAKAA